MNTIPRRQAGNVAHLFVPAIGVLLVAGIVALSPLNWYYDVAGLVMIALTAEYLRDGENNE